ncbi:hypothetical protein [Kineococcus arenarius]|uniref:hypothetical protein n=1 Tax=unclassified Kineococcus TaxID=2621656 RepID=UPI003D7D1A71
MTPNQTIAYNWISQGTPIVTVPRGANAQAAGLTPGMPITLEPQVQIYVNAPNGSIVVRNY